MTQLIKINASDYGLEEKKAKQISDMFKPMLDKMVELEKEFNTVVKLKIDKTTIAKAKELRRRYVKTRTGTAEIHQKLKAFYLQGGRFVDAWKNTQLMTSLGIEEKLTAIEKHFEILECERIVRLKEKRFKQLQKYGIDEMPVELGLMTDEVWNNYLTGAKMNYETRKAAELKAEQDSIKREKEEQEERERIRKDNERLRKEAEERDRLAKIEARKRDKAEADRNAKLQAEREKREKAEKERIEKEENERKERERLAKIERDKRLKLENELRLKKEKEEKAETERLAGIEAELRKGDSEKVQDLIDDLQVLKTKYQFQSKENKIMYNKVYTSIGRIIDFIKDN